MCNSLKATDKMIFANAKGGGAKRSEGRVKVATPVDLKAANKSVRREGEFQGRLKTQPGKKKKKKVFAELKKVPMR